PTRAQRPLRRRQTNKHAWSRDVWPSHATRSTPALFRSPPPPPPQSPLFPYTTLFRSRGDLRGTRDCQAARLADRAVARAPRGDRSEEHTSELQSLRHLVCRLLLEKKKKAVSGSLFSACGALFYSELRRIQVTVYCAPH